MVQAGRMNTRITRSPHVAATILRKGGLVAFPTETVYGLGADALNTAAVNAIFRAKGRPHDNPLIVHIAHRDQLAQVAAHVSPVAQTCIDHFFPGPLTVIVPRHPDLSAAVTAGLDTVGVRLPGHPVAHAFLTACGCPVAAPSANRSGRPSPTYWSAVAHDLNGRIDCILKGNAATIGLESTVVDCTRSRPVILREGAVSREQLETVLPDLARTGRRHQRGAVRSPGIKYRHYAPDASVLLVAGPHEVSGPQADRAAFIGLDNTGFSVKPLRARFCRDEAEYARVLFRFFRECERSNIRTIYCQRVPATGLGRALMDRLQRASNAGPPPRTEPHPPD